MKKFQLELIIHIHCREMRGSVYRSSQFVYVDDEIGMLRCNQTKNYSKGVIYLVRSPLLRNLAYDKVLELEGLPQGLKTSAFADDLVMMVKVLTESTSPDRAVQLQPS